MKEIQLPENNVFKAAAAVAQEQNIPAFLVGGFVRDILLNRPTKDIDFVCVGNGIDFAKAVATKLSPTLQVNFFKNYGTAQFNYHGIDYEFVGARKESYQADSRNPVVESGSIEDDQNRRDFTINALAISLNKTTHGEFVDPFNGLDDLENKIIRTPLDPNITFSDDPLRMLRAVRFTAQLNFKIQNETFQAIRQNKDRISIISQERITTELNKIMESPKPSIGLDLLHKTGLLRLVLPELEDLHGVEEYKGKGHKDNFYHTLQVIDNVAEKSTNLWLRWAALLHDIAKPQTKAFDEKNGWSFHGHEVVGSKMVVRIFKKLKLPLDAKMEFVKKLVYLHLRPISLSKEHITDSALRRLLYEAGDDIDDLMMLCEADITSKNKEKVIKYLRNFQLVRIRLAELEARDKIRNFQPPISGELIIKTFGIEPSNIVGVIKNSIKDAILDGIIHNNYEEAYEYMLKLGAENNLNEIKNT